MGETTWTLKRTGQRVRVDLKKATGFTHADTEAIAVALEGYLGDDEVTVIQLDGPVLMEERPPDGLGEAMRELGNLSRSRGKRFDVGPI